MSDIERGPVKIRVGSQQKRLAEGSTVSGWDAIHSASEARTNASRHTRKPSRRAHNSPSRLSQQREHSPYVPSSSSHIERHEESHGPESSIRPVPNPMYQPSSSSPLVRHVSRLRTESLARSRYPNSQDTNSILARVGRTIPDILSSQKYSSAKWMNWFRGGGTSNVETTDESQCSLEAQISPGVSQRYQQETESSWAGLSEDLPPIPHHGEVIGACFDHPAIRSSEDTSEALDRYEQLLAVVQGDQQHVGYSHSADPMDISTDNYDLNATSSFVEESMSGADLDSRAAAMVNDNISAESSSLHLTTRFGNKSKSSGDLGLGDLTHSKNEVRGMSSFVGDSEETITSSKLRYNEHASSESIANAHKNLWLNDSPSLESSDDVTKYQNTTQTLEADEGWRSFVFGDDNSDEVELTAFTQALRDAAQALQPSECSTSSHTNEAPEMEHNSTRATVCPLYTADISQTSDSMEPWSSSDVPSVGVNVSSSILESDVGIITNQMNESSEGTPRPHVGGDHRDSTHRESISDEFINEALNSQGSAGRHSLREQSIDQESSNKGSISTESCSWESPHGEPSKTRASRSAQYVGSNSSGSLPTPTDLSSNAESTLAPPRSVGVVKQSGVPGVEEQARFAPPKLFVGSRSKPQERSKTPAVLGVATKRRGRPKKQAIDGRADIRGIPNYMSDPIEDFEDQQPTQKSMFPALELV